jgi:hypothetical protein
VRLVFDDLIFDDLVFDHTLLAAMRAAGRYT